MFRMQSHIEVKLASFHSEDKRQNPDWQHQLLLHSTLCV
jgi:hypothetical protein